MNIMIVSVRLLETSGVPKYSSPGFGSRKDSGSAKPRPPFMILMIMVVTPRFQYRPHGIVWDDVQYHPIGIEWDDAQYPPNRGLLLPGTRILDLNIFWDIPQEIRAISRKLS